MAMVEEDFFESDIDRRNTTPRRGGPHRFRNGALIVLGSILALGAITALILVMTSISSGPRAPDVVGISYEEARRRVESSDLEIRIDPLQDSSGECDELKVEEQDPEPGATMEKGEVVTVRLEGLTESPELLNEDGSSQSSPSEMELPGEQVTPPTQGEGPAPDASPAATSAPITVCLDPGHSAGCPSSEIDQATGLDVADNEGAAGERKAMWELAQVTKNLLQTEGYQVRLTKQRQDDYASLRTRAEIGNTCSVMVRLHYDTSLHAVLYPVEGQYKKRGDSIVYVKPQVAAASAELAQSLFGPLQAVGVTKIRSDCGGTSNNSGPAFVGSVLSNVPVALIENDPSFVRDNPAGQQRVAGAITEGLNAYFRGQ